MLPQPRATTAHQGLSLLEAHSHLADGTQGACAPEIVKSCSLSTSPECHASNRNNSSALPLPKQHATQSSMVSGQI